MLSANTDPQVDINRVFQALGDATRRNMIDTLSSGPQSVSSLAAPLNMSLAAVVQHLQILEDSGIVISEKIGRVRTCKVVPAALSAAENWLHERRSLWERRLDRLGDVLAEDN